MNLTWLDEHLETFVRPVLGSIPSIREIVPGTNLSRWTPDKIRMLHLIWDRIVKLAEDRVILLPGRDVWLFAVIANIKGNHPFEFRKEISGEVARSKILKDTLAHHHCLDTGFRGTVPTNLGIKHWHLIEWHTVARGGEGKKETLKDCYKRIMEHQIFPFNGHMPTFDTLGRLKRKGSPLNCLAGQLEGTLKYWDPGACTYDNMGLAVGLKEQKITVHMDTFSQAAIATRLIGESCLKER